MDTFDVETRPIVDVTAVDKTSGESLSQPDCGGDYLEEDIAVATVVQAACDRMARRRQILHRTCPTLPGSMGVAQVLDRHPEFDF